MGPMRPLARLALWSALALAAPGCGDRSTPPGPAAASSTSPPTPAGPDVLALLDHLAPGQPLGPTEVVAVEAPRQGRIAVQVRLGDARGQLDVALRGPGPRPPASSQKYAVFYASPRPDLTPVPPASLAAACEALASRLRIREDATPTPAGLAPYGAPGQSL